MKVMVMRKHRKKVMILAVIVLFCGGLALALFITQKNLRSFFRDAGIKKVEDVAYVEFEIYDGKKFQTPYYITDREQIKDMYQLYVKTGYKIYEGGLEDTSGEEDACIVRFGAENGKIATFYEYYKKDEDIYTVMGMIDGGYYNILKGYDKIVVKKDFREALQEFVESELEEISLEDVRKMVKNTEDELDVFDLYAYKHEKIDEYDSVEDELENMYELCKFELADDDGYIEVKCQNHKLYMPEDEDCRWYRNILSIELYDADGNLIEAIY